MKRGERIGNEDKVERKQAWAGLDFSVSTRASWNLNVMPLGNISKNIMPRVLILILKSFGQRFQRVLCSCRSEGNVTFTDLFDKIMYNKKLIFNFGFQRENLILRFYEERQT